MRIYLAEPGSTSFRRLAGPGDLSGTTAGTVRLVGEPDTADAGLWTVALGLFALRGGEIRRRGA